MNFFRIVLDDAGRDLLDSKVREYTHGKSVLTESVETTCFCLLYS
jgi:hypothetical protein